MRPGRNLIKWSGRLGFDFGLFDEQAQQPLREFGNGIFRFGGCKHTIELAETFPVNGSRQTAFHCPRFDLGFQVGRDHEIIFDLTLTGLSGGVFIRPRIQLRTKPPISSAIHGISVSPGRGSENPLVPRKKAAMRALAGQPYRPIDVRCVWS